MFLKGSAGNRKQNKLEFTDPNLWVDETTTVLPVFNYCQLSNLMNNLRNKSC